MEQFLKISPRSLRGNVGHYFAKDRNLLFVDGNESFLQLNNMKSTEELQGRDDFSMSWGNCFAEHYRQHDRDTLNGLSYLNLEPIIDYRGDKSYHLTYKFPYFDEEGTPAGIIGQAITIPDKYNLRLLATLFKDKKHGSIKIHDELYNTYCEGKISSELTQRESQVLYYLLQNMTAREIGQLIFLSRRTIENHIDNIKHKLCCDSRSQIVNFGMANGLMNILPFDIFARLLHP